MVHPVSSEDVPVSVFFFQKIIAAPDQVLKNCVDASVLVGILNVKAHKRARKFRDSFNFQHLKDVL